MPDSSLIFEYCHLVSSILSVMQAAQEEKKRRKKMMKKRLMIAKRQEMKSINSG